MKRFPMCGEAEKSSRCRLSLLSLPRIRMAGTRRETQRQETVAPSHACRYLLVWPWSLNIPALPADKNRGKGTLSPFPSYLNLSCLNGHARWWAWPFPCPASDSRSVDNDQHRRCARHSGVCALLDPQLRGRLALCLARVLMPPQQIQRRGLLCPSEARTRRTRRQRPLCFRQHGGAVLHPGRRARPPASGQPPRLAVQTRSDHDCPGLGRALAG